MVAAESVASVAIVFTVAGWVKGVTGMGLPTVVMGALGLVMAPVQAAALLLVPSLVTNVCQFATGPHREAIIRRLLPMMLCVCLGTGVGIGLLTSGSSRWPSVALGGVLAAYALLALFLPRLSVPATAERLLSPVVGAITGVLTGATGGWLCGAWGVWLSARLRFWEGPGGVRAMATVALATSLALLFVDAGQPDVRLFRIGLAAWGIGGAAAALMQGREDFQQ